MHPDALAWFGLRADPFVSRPDAAPFVTTPPAAPVLAYCRATIAQQGGMALVYGPEGAGKTAVALELRRQLLAARPERVVALVDAGALTTRAHSTVRELARAVGATGSLQSYRVYRALEEAAVRHVQRGATPVVLVDRAELLAGDGLRALLNLWNLVPPDASRFALRLALFGRPGLLATLRRQRNANLLSRVSFGHSELCAMDEAELGALLGARVSECGGSSSLITASASAAIRTATLGHPGPSLDMAGRALEVAYRHRAHAVAKEHVLAALGEPGGRRGLVVPVANLSHRECLDVPILDSHIDEAFRETVIRSVRRDQA